MGIELSTNIFVTTEGKLVLKTTEVNYDEYIEISGVSKRFSVFLYFTTINPF